MSAPTRRSGPVQARPVKTAAAKRNDLLGSYYAGREGVLGERMTVPVLDPVAAFEAIVVELGDRTKARRYVADLFLASRLEGGGR